MKRSVDGLLYDIIAYLKANENERSNSIFLKRCKEAYNEQLTLTDVVASSLEKQCETLNIDPEDVLLLYCKSDKTFEILYDEGIEIIDLISKGVLIVK